MCPGRFTNIFIKLLKYNFIAILFILPNTRFFVFVIEVWCMFLLLARNAFSVTVNFFTGRQADEF